MKTQRNRSERTRRGQLARRAIFQQLDQRMLMAGDTSIAIDAAHSAALIYGFHHLDNFGDRLADTKVAFDGQNSVVATLNHQQSSPLSGELGFLGFEVQNEAVDYDLNVGLAFPNQPTDGFAADELTASPLGTLFDFDLAGQNDFSADLPMIVRSNGLDLGANPADPDKPRIVIQDGNQFDGEFDNCDPFFTVENGEQLADFKTVTAVGIYTALQTVHDVFVGIQQNDSFQKQIPFTNGTTLADVLDVGGAFDANSIDEPDATIELLSIDVSQQAGWFDGCVSFGGANDDCRRISLGRRSQDWRFDDE